MILLSITLHTHCIHALTLDEALTSDLSKHLSAVSLTSCILPVSQSAVSLSTHPSTVSLLNTEYTFTTSTFIYRLKCGLIDQKGNKQSLPRDNASQG